MPQNDTKSDLSKNRPIPHDRHSGATRISYVAATLACLFVIPFRSGYLSFHNPTDIVHSVTQCWLSSPTQRCLSSRRAMSFVFPQANVVYYPATMLVVSPQANIVCQSPSQCCCHPARPCRLSFRSGAKESASSLLVILSVAKDPRISPLPLPQGLTPAIYKP